MRPGRPLLLAATLALPLGLAACGDDDTDAGSGQSDPTAAPAGDPQTVDVEIPAFSYSPDPVEIQVGDSIIWENTHDQPHTATGTSGFRFDTGNIAAGESSEPIEFTEAGSFTYICALHPFMEATVEVSG